MILCIPVPFRAGETPFCQQTLCPNHNRCLWAPDISIEPWVADTEQTQYGGSKSTPEWRCNILAFQSLLDELEELEARTASSHMRTEQMFSGYIHPREEYFKPSCLILVHIFDSIQQISTNHFCL
jgi:hypothetical protein